MQIQVDQYSIAKFCRRNHIRKLAFFGSVLRDDFRPDSDVDVLVEFEPGHTPGWDIVDMQDELSVMFGGRQIDLLTFKGLHPFIKDRVLQEAQVLYAA